MKNIHVLPTNKPSRVFNTNKGEYYFREHYVPDTIQTCKNYNIYITSDEEIKEGDWCIDLDTYTLFKLGNWKTENGKKIILTTDQDLIGVQAIDDEFLEWFVKNPSCEEVPIITVKYLDKPTYRTNIGFEKWRIGTIPQGEPKQETLEDSIYQAIGLAANEQGIINQALATSKVMDVLKKQIYETKND